MFPRQPGAASRLRAKNAVRSIGRLTFPWTVIAVPGCTAMQAYTRQFPCSNIPGARETEPLAQLTTSGRDALLFLTDGIGIDRCGGQLGLPQPLPAPNSAECRPRRRPRHTEPPASHAVPGPEVGAVSTDVVFAGAVRDCSGTGSLWAPVGACRAIDTKAARMARPGGAVA